MIKITGQVVGAERVVLRLKSTPGRVITAVRRTVRMLGLELEAYIKTTKLSGQVLNRRSGRLARSVNTKFISSETGEIARVGTKLVYGRAWELGFHVPAREILPRTKLALFWPGAAHPVASVSQPARTQAARPWLRPALDEMRPSIRPRIAAAVALAAAES